MELILKVFRTLYLICCLVTLWLSGSYLFKFIFRDGDEEGLLKASVGFILVAVGGRILLEIHNAHDDTEYLFVVVFLLLGMIPYYLWLAGIY